MIISELIAKYLLPLIAIIGAFGGTYLLGKRKAEIVATQEKAKAEVERVNQVAAATVAAKETEIKTVQVVADETSKVNVLPDAELDSELSKWVTRK